MGLFKFGVNLFLWTAAFTKDTLNLLPKVAELGFDGVEIPIDLIEQIDVKGTKKLLDSTGLASCCCGVLGSSRDLISEDSVVRENAKNYIKTCIEVAAQWGSDVFCGPLYSAVGKLVGRGRTQQEWDLCVRELFHLGEHAGNYGVTLAIEPLNRFETYFLNTVEDAIKLVKEINHPNVKVHLDTFHMNIEEKNFYDAVKSAGEFLFHMHCSDNDRGIPGTGHVDWNGIFKGLGEIKYGRWLVIETFVPGIKEIAKAAAIWRPIAPSSDVIATEGLKFLRAQVGKSIHSSA